MNISILRHPFFVALAVLIFSGIGFLFRYYYLGDRPSQSQGGGVIESKSNTKNSPCSINTFDQSGGNNTLHCDPAVYDKIIEETFCYDQLKDSFKIEGVKKFLELPLKNKPVLNSLYVWEGNDSVPTRRYEVIGNMIKLEVYLKDIDQLKMYCTDSSYHFDNKVYVVKYLPDN